MPQQHTMKIRNLLFVCLLLISLSVRANESKISTLLSNLKSEKVDSNKIEIYSKIIEYYYLANPDSAKIYLKKGMDFVNTLDYPKGLALMYVCETKIRHSHSEFSKARETAQKAIDIFYELGDQKGLGITYNLLGIIEAKSGNFSLATSYLLRSLKIYEKINYVEGIILDNLGLGIVNLQVNNYKQSYKYLTTSYDLSKKTNNLSSIDACSNLGMLFAVQGDMKTAIDYFELALADASKTTNVAQNITLLNNLANAHAKLNNTTKAMEFYDEALRLSLKFNFPEEEARVKLNIGLLFENTNPKLAIDYAEKSLDIAKNVGNKFLLIEIFESIYVLKSKTRDFEGAIYALEKFHAYQDTVLNEQNKSEIDLLQSNFELEKSKAEVKELELTTQKQAQRRTFVIILIIAMLCILGLVTYISFKRKRLNIALRKSVLIREKFLSVLTHDLKTPINNVLSLINELDKENLTADEKRTLLDVLKKQTQLSMITLDNILRWGQLQFRGIKTEPKEFLVKDVVNNNVELFEVNAKRKNVKFNLNFNDDTKAFTDEDQIDFIFRNLFSNALKYSKFDSTITIDINKNANGALVISIKDEGIGMNSETLNSLFSTDPKINYGTSSEKGSGLGLLLCKEFVEANEGKIWIESVLNKGTTVHFTCKAA